MMKVNIAESDAVLGEGVSFSFTTSAEEIDVIHEDYSFPGVIAVEGTIVNTGSVYRLKGLIQCKKSFTCDRCLGHFEQDKQYRFSENFKLWNEDADESEDVNYFSGDAIDIGGLVRDTILAAQPLNNICSPDCRGLCPICGADLNQGECGCDRFVPDPRLAALQQLLKKE